MQRTSKYQMTWFEEGDLTIPTVETQRWETVDAQLYAMFSILGNGIIQGWNLTAGNNLSVMISAGRGHVNFVAVESTVGSLITALVPNTRNYIFAGLTVSSYWLQSVTFYSFIDQDNTGKLVYLGYVDADTTGITNVNMDGRNEIGYIGNVRELISEHQHIGGTLNPSQIDLASNVEGELNTNNLPDLNASKINEGVLDADRIPNLDHITGLINNGILTHAQLDAFVASLSVQNASLMGDISTTNMLKTVLTLKRGISSIDDDFLNEIALIPGISPDTYIDSVNSTASWDTGTGTIYAEPAGTPLRFFTEAFNIGDALKSFLVTYEGTIQFGASSSESSSASQSHSVDSMSVRFAVAAKDSTTISDYEYVTPHKVSDVTALLSDGSIKVMIEFNGDNGEVIVMQGFSFMFSSTGVPQIIG